jgi:hypothetical protein
VGADRRLTRHDVTRPHSLDWSYQIPKPCVACSNHAGGAHSTRVSPLVPFADGFREGMMAEGTPDAWRVRIFIGHDPVTGHPRQCGAPSRAASGRRRPSWPGLSPRSKPAMHRSWVPAPLRRSGTTRLRIAPQAHHAAAGTDPAEQAHRPRPRSGLPVLARRGAVGDHRSPSSRRDQCCPAIRSTPASGGFTVASVVPGGESKRAVHADEVGLGVRARTAARVMLARDHPSGRCRSRSVGPTPGGLLSDRPPGDRCAIGITRSR